MIKVGDMFRRVSPSRIWVEVGEYMVVRVFPNKKSVRLSLVRRYYDSEVVLDIMSSKHWEKIT